MDAGMLCRLAEKIATPAYVFDRAVFREKALETRKIVGDGIGLCFSVKANPFLTDRYFDPLTLFDRFEVCSPGELRICMASGIPAERIVFSGLNKRLSEIEEAFACGVRLFTIESLQQLAAVSRTGEQHGEALPVLIRISADSQFGMEEAVVREIIRDRDQYPYIDIAGVHYFTGTQKKGYGIISRELSFLKEFCESVKDLYDFQIRHVEYGPGLGVEYFEDQKPGAVSVEPVLDDLRALRSVTAVTIEMGRYFAAECGYYYTKVVDCKSNEGTNYAVTDGGMNQLHYDGQVRSMKVPLHTHIKPDPAADRKYAPSAGKAAGETQRWTLCGSICSTEDVICRDAAYASLAENDLLVFRNCGAYSFMEAMSAFLSREMPQIWACTGGRDPELLRDFIYTDSLNRRMPEK